MKKNKAEMRIEYKRPDFTSLARGKFYKEAATCTTPQITNMTAKCKTASFSAVVQKPADAAVKNLWGFILLPKEMSQLAPRRGRTTVMATINGHTIQVTLEPDGNLSHWFRIDAQVLQAAQINIGDDVEVSIALLAVEPAPTAPADFAKALTKNLKAKSVWNATTAIAQVDWIHWIESGKLAKTRDERIGKACDMLASGKKRVCCFDPSGFYSKSLSAPKVAV